MTMEEIESRQLWRRSNHIDNRGDPITTVMGEIQSHRQRRRSNHNDDGRDP